MAVDVSAEIAAFKAAYYGEDVRDGIVDLAQKLADGVNNAIDHEFVTVDDTLSERGQGADAWATGEELRKKAPIQDPTLYGTVTVAGDLLARPHVGNAETPYRYGHWLHIYSAVDLFPSTTAIFVKASDDFAKIAQYITYADEDVELRVWSYCEEAGKTGIRYYVVDRAIADETEVIVYAHRSDNGDPLVLAWNGTTTRIITT